MHSDPLDQHKASLPKDMPPESREEQRRKAAEYVAEPARTPVTYRLLSQCSVIGPAASTVGETRTAAAAELGGRPGVTVLVPGGRLRSGDLALSNGHTVAFFAELRADLAFLGSGGITPDGLTDFHLDEVATRREMLRHSGRCFVLADGSKIGRTAPYRVCGLAAPLLVSRVPLPAASISACAIQFRRHDSEMRNSFANSADRRESYNC